MKIKSIQAVFPERKLHPRTETMKVCFAKRRESVKSNYLAKGQPKGILRTVGGHLVSVCWTMKTVYNMDKDSIWWVASDMGWVVGHSYICYGPLLYGATSVMYEGKPDRTPDAAQYFRFQNTLLKSCSILHHAQRRFHVSSYYFQFRSNAAHCCPQLISVLTKLPQKTRRMKWNVPL